MAVEAPALSMASEYVEVCFPAWPAPRAVAMPVAARPSLGIGVAPLASAAFVLAAVAVPGALAVISVVTLALLLAFVLLAPAALVILAWACWRHDRRAAIETGAR